MLFHISVFLIVSAVVHVVLSSAPSLPRVVTTLAGDGSSTTRDGDGTNARFDFPLAVAWDVGRRVLYVSQLGGSLRRVTPDGVVSTMGGIGDNCYGLAMDSSGDYLLATDYDGSAIRRVPLPSGMTIGMTSIALGYHPVSVTRVIGSRSFAIVGHNSRIDLFDPVSNTLTSLVSATGGGGYWGIASDTRGTLYVTGPNGVRKVVGNSLVNVVSGFASSLAAVYYHRAKQLLFNDGNGNKIWTVAGLPHPSPTISIVAGWGVGNADGYGTDARFSNAVYGLAVDEVDNVIYVADYDNHRIRKISGGTPYPPLRISETPTRSQSLSATASSAATQSSSFGSLSEAATRSASDTMLPSSTISYGHHDSVSASIDASATPSSTGEITCTHPTATPTVVSSLTTTPSVLSSSTASATVVSSPTVTSTTTLRTPSISRSSTTYVWSYSQSLTVTVTPTTTFSLLQSLTLSRGTRSASSTATISTATRSNISSHSLSISSSPIHSVTPTRIPTQSRTPYIPQPIDVEPIVATSAATTAAGAVAAVLNAASGASGDAASMAAIGLMACSPNAMKQSVAPMSYLISPFIHFGPSAMVLGNVGIALGFAVLQVAAIVGRVWWCGAPSCGRRHLIGAALRFPYLTLVVSTVLLQGIVCGSVIAASEAAGGNSVWVNITAAVVGAAVVVAVFVVFCYAVPLCCNELCVFVPRSADSSASFLHRLVVPRGRWEPAEITQRFGFVFSAVNGGAQRWYLVGAHAHTLAFVFASRVPFGSCLAQFSVLCVMQCAMVAVVLYKMPLRCVTDNLIAAAGNALLSLLLLFLALDVSLIDNQIVQTDVVIALLGIVQGVLMLLRLLLSLGMWLYERREDSTNPIEEDDPPGSPPQRRCCTLNMLVATVVAALTLEKCPQTQQVVSPNLCVVEPLRDMSLEMADDVLVEAQEDAAVADENFWDEFGQAISAHCELTNVDTDIGLEDSTHSYSLWDDLSAYAVR